MSSSPSWRALLKRNVTNAQGRLDDVPRLTSSIETGQGVHARSGGGAGDSRREQMFTQPHEPGLSRKRSKRQDQEWKLPRHLERWSRV